MPSVANDTVEDQQSPGKLPQSLLQVEQLQIQPPTTPYKSFCTFISVALILAISSVQFGYALCQVSTVNINTLVETFGIKIDVGVANGILVGIMPVGGIVGCFLNQFLLAWFSRKNIHYIMCVVNVISSTLEQITTPYTITVGRFLLGICCGVYTAVAAQYIKQISPFKLRPLFGSLFSMGRIFGIVFCYALGLILSLENVENYWRIMFVLPGAMAVIQTILLVLFVPDSPVEMLQRGNNDRLEEYVAEYYREQHFHNVITEYRVEHELQQNSLKADDTGNSYMIDSLVGNKRRAFIMAIHLSILREWIGGNTIMIFAGQMISSVDKEIAPYANTILNTIQLITTAVSTFWLGSLFGRKPLYMSSGVILATSCYLIALGFIIEVNDLIISFMVLYVAIYGLLFAPVCWAYPSEILPPSKVSAAIATSWIALAIATIFPPIILQKMHGDAYPIFLFFAVFTTFSLIYMGIKLVESKGFKYKQIIQKY